MSSLKHLFQNGLIKAMFIGIVILSLLCISLVNQMLAKMDVKEQSLIGYEWIIPLGMYDEINAAEFQESVYFLAGEGEEGNRTYTIYEWDGTSLKINENWHIFLTSGKENNLSRKVHPAGYWISRDKDGMECVTDLERNQLTSYRNEFTFELTELPGYVIDRVQDSVISLNNQSIVYRAPENEGIHGQMGDYWIMEVDIPREGRAPITLLYLRNQDFSMALDGMLFTVIREIESGTVCGEAVTNVSYDDLPAKLIYSEERIVEADGSWRAVSPDAGKMGIMGADDGYYTTWARNTDKLRLHFFDGTDSAPIEGGMKPFGPRRNGIIAFRMQDDDLKTGFMNSKGEIIVEPIFSEWSIPHMDTAVVVHDGQVGVLRLKGGDGDE